MKQLLNKFIQSAKVERINNKKMARIYSVSQSQNKNERTTHFNTCQNGKMTSHVIYVLNREPNHSFNLFPSFFVL